MLRVCSCEGGGEGPRRVAQRQDACRERCHAQVRFVSENREVYVLLSSYLCPQTIDVRTFALRESVRELVPSETLE